jgi:hypothetical protein
MPRVERYVLIDSVGNCAHELLGRVCIFTIFNMPPQCSEVALPIQADPAGPHKQLSAV